MHFIYFVHHHRTTYLNIYCPDWTRYRLHYTRCTYPSSSRSPCVPKHHNIHVYVCSTLGNNAILPSRPRNSVRTLPQTQTHTHYDMTTCGLCIRICDGCATDVFFLIFLFLSQIAPNYLKDPKNRCLRMMMKNIMMRGVPHFGWQRRNVCQPTPRSEQICIGWTTRSSEILILNQKKYIPEISTHEPRHTQRQPNRSSRNAFETFRDVLNQRH